MAYFYFHPFPEHPIVCRLSKSLRFKAITIRVHSKEELRVSAPVHLNLNEIHKCLSSKKKWILEQVSHTRTKTPDQIKIPKKIVFPLTSQSWTIIKKNIKHPGSATVKILGTDTLLLYGDREHKEAIINCLQHWLIGESKKHLTPILKKLSKQYKIPFCKVRFKNHKTRWGSCSSKGNINLNCQLLFLPFPLVEYVMLHELCHRIVPNHSHAFWNQLGSILPDCLMRRQELKQAVKFIPEWAFPS